MFKLAMVLPVELVKEIVDICATFPNPHRSSTLRKCLHVSRAFYLASRPHLFGTLELNADASFEDKAPILYASHSHTPPIYTLAHTLILRTPVFFLDADAKVRYFSSTKLIEVLELLSVVSASYRGIRCLSIETAECHHALWIPRLTARLECTLISSRAQSVIQKLCSLPTLRSVLLKNIAFPFSFLADTILPGPNPLHLSLTNCEGRVAQVSLAPSPVAALASLAFDRFTMVDYQDQQANPCTKVANAFIRWTDISQLQSLTFDAAPTERTLTKWLRQTHQLERLHLSNIPPAYYTLDESPFKVTPSSLTHFSLAQFGPSLIVLEPPNSPTAVGSPLFRQGAVEDFATHDGWPWPRLHVLPPNLTHFSISLYCDIKAPWRLPDDPVEHNKLPIYIHDNGTGCSYFDILAYILGECAVPHITLQATICLSVFSAPLLPLSREMCARLEADIRDDISEFVDACNKRRTIPILSNFTIEFGSRTNDFNFSLF